MEDQITLQPQSILSKTLALIPIVGKTSPDFPNTFWFFSRYSWRCKCLKDLDLGENRLSGNLPNELGQLKSLSSLSVDRNSFSGQILISLGGISSMGYLDIGHNFFKGIMSEKHLGNLTNLEYLGCIFNLLTVQVSSNWTPPFRLRRLNLGHCFLRPPFPAWLQTLKCVEDLDMPYAGISSVIPAWFWTRSYVNVDLSHNQIISSLSSLHFSSIYLRSNNFTGPPPQISSDVAKLDLSNNLFGGSLSHMLCQGRTNKEKNLESLDVSGNLLSGELPNCWMYWRQLTVLKLGNNNLKMNNDDISSVKIVIF